jgi:hypothetical protein
MAGRWWLAALLTAGCIFAAFAFGVNYGEKRAERNYKPRVIVEHRRDTITRVKPVYIASTPIVRIDTLILRERDTIAVPVPIERRVYADSNYRAVVSGWHPSLDSISVYPETRVITIERERVEKERSRWGLGIQAGAGLSANGAAVPYVGVGVQYNLFSW